MPRVIAPVDHPDDAFFWAAAHEGRLVARGCAECGRIQHPPSPLCPACGSPAWTERDLSGQGTVHSWIVSRHPTSPDDDPRIVALVQTEEGVRLVSNLTSVAASDVVNGMPVEVTFVEADGVTMPFFRPAGTTQEA